jgi:hypothetical protein
VKFSITSMAATAIVGIAVGGIATAPTAVADYPLAGRHPEPERPQR